MFDDIFDTGDDTGGEDDPAPLVPRPANIEENCSCLDNPAILFLNSNLLLELRKDWRLLYSRLVTFQTFNKKAGVFIILIFI